MSETAIIDVEPQQGFEELNELWSRLDQLEAAVIAYSDKALSFVEEPLEEVLESLRSFEPSVSIIGQIKAGKSTLLNALVGQVGLLPSDVNPWTSVITALHVNSRYRPMNTRAMFRFFDRHEWDRLVATGGRLGEMADRAGFKSEADQVRQQVGEMRQSTEARLGEEFDRLIGGSHTFPELDKNTIDRYICYGDPDELLDGSNEGVYADLTKSADLYIDLPNLPRGLCLRDTPGVNDTFMMREQITLNAISDSRVCVVVLSAHQALSTMDLALLRIICSVEAREVLIFVNRMDELADPAAEQIKIRASIERTLSRLGLGEGIDILFGSGYWASCALGDITSMVAASQQSLARLFPGDDLSDPELMRRRAQEASGIHALHRAIATRVVEGPGNALLNDMRAQLNMIIEMSETVENVATRADDGSVRIGITEVELLHRLADVRDRALQSFDENAQVLRGQLRERLERAQQSFLATAITALQLHIETFGEIGTWNHDPTGLRMSMRTAFTSQCAKLRRQGEEAFDLVLEGVQEILEKDMGVFREGSSVEFPEQPQHKSPTVLARTLSLDLQGSWWRKYWRFGSARSAEKRYASVILEETQPLINDLITDFYDPAIERTREVVNGFSQSQSNFCKAIIESVRGRDSLPGSMQRIAERRTA